MTFLVGTSGASPLPFHEKIVIVVAKYGLLIFFMFWDKIGIKVVGFGIFWICTMFMFLIKRLCLIFYIILSLILFIFFPFSSLSLFLSVFLHFLLSLHPSLARMLSYIRYQQSLCKKSIFRSPSLLQCFRYEFRILVI